MIDPKPIVTIEREREGAEREDVETFFARWHELAEQIDAVWKDKTVTAIAAVQEQRREL